MNSTTSAGLAALCLLAAGCGASVSPAAPDGGEDAGVAVDA
ncbi:MAG: hypothetical protein JWM10_5348, partial [Myxococcaceae bacterium]|nr:hypothetical protein [Myxococcaceae bacterium]